MHYFRLLLIEVSLSGRGLGGSSAPNARMKEDESDDDEAWIESPQLNFIRSHFSEATHMLNRL